MKIQITELQISDFLLGRYKCVCEYVNKVTAVFGYALCKHIKVVCVCMSTHCKPTCLIKQRSTTNYTHTIANLTTPDRSHLSSLVAVHTLGVTNFTIMRFCGQSKSDYVCFDFSDYYCMILW